MSLITLEGLLSDCKLKDSDLDEKLDRSHFPEISRYLPEWRVLSSKLPGFSESVINAIEVDNSLEDWQRLAFLSRLKQKLSVKATYRVLVNGLLEIERAEDARNLCSFLAGVLKSRIQGVSADSCLQCDLSERIGDLKKKFFIVVQDVEDSFRERKLCVSDIKSSLKFIPEHEKYLQKKPEIRSDIFVAKPLEELFHILSGIWDYLHPGLLQFIVTMFGCDEDKVRVETYLQELNSFREKTKLGEFLKTSNMKMNQTPFGKTLSTTMRDRWEDMTLQDVENCRVQFAEKIYCESFLVKSFPKRS